MSLEREILLLTSAGKAIHEKGMFGYNKQGRYGALLITNKGYV
jgi:hypothetical protein